MVFRKEIISIKSAVVIATVGSWQFFIEMIFWWIKLHKKNFYFGKKILN